MSDNDSGTNDFMSTDSPKQFVNSSNKSDSFTNYYLMTIMLRLLKEAMIDYQRFSRMKFPLMMVIDLLA